MRSCRPGAAELPEKGGMMNKQIEMPSLWWEPGAEDAPNILPEEEWIPEDVELPFE